MARKSASTAIEKTSDEEREAAALAELGDFFDSVSIDGLEDVGGEDLKLGVRLWNMKGLDKSGRAYPRDVFFDTISEDTSEELDAVLLLTQKSKRWDSYNNATEKTEVHCASEDRITGTMADGTRRACLGCPDDGWFRDDEGKPYRKCGEQHTVVAVERLTQKPFLIRFKKTALKPFRNYLMQHHWGMRSSGGKRANIPLFVYGCRITLAMHESGNYAVPVLTRGDMLPRPDIEAMHENAQAFVEIMGEVQKHADEHESAHAAGESDGNLSADDFAD